MANRVHGGVTIGSVILAGLAGAVGLMAGGRTPLAQSSATKPDRLPAMQHHFAQVFIVHEALIRGDLAAVRTPAAQLASLSTPAGMSDAGLGFVAAIRTAGAKAADARTLTVAAKETATMLTQCGECHRTLGVPVAVGTPGGHDVGGVVGHMLDHQRAADDMLRGLFVPSASQWRDGAEQLGRAATLPENKLPADPKWSKALRQADGRIHALAKEAQGDADPTARAARYAQIIVVCAECHSLHSRIWGPTGGR